MFCQTTTRKATPPVLAPATTLFDLLQCARPEDLARNTVATLHENLKFVTHVKVFRTDQATFVYRLKIAPLDLTNEF